MSGVVEGGWSCVTQMSIPSFVTGIPPGYTLGIATCSQVGTGHPLDHPFPRTPSPRPWPVASLPGGCCQRYPVSITPPLDKGSQTNLGKGQMSD